MTPSPTPVTGRADGPLATITLSRPEKRNALTVAMWRRLAELARDLPALPGVRLLVLRGAGGVFSAGADLNDVLASTAGEAAATRCCRAVVDALFALVRCPVPTVAAIDGVAAGGGVELALAADNRLATPASTLQLPFARLGVVPDTLTLNRLIALAGPATAQWMVMTASPLSAADCLRTGLIDALATDGLDPALAQLGEQIGRTSPTALARTRALLWASQPPLDADAAAEEMIRSFLSADVAAAAGRFVHRGSHTGAGSHTVAGRSTAPRTDGVR
ncbi:enoyl-CoA hydratase/isomerase family protein [Streptomyces sioyaensis]|uniref:enoyl-CoA hydratase/isomerase family protein n=1 Tax=Streptomyces sioyaensis TaxID=67364 RepID=UPI003EC118FB